MVDQFVITYCQPGEPFDDRAVTAVEIALESRRHQVRIARERAHWIVLYAQSRDDTPHPTFQGALATAHLNAYFFASDLLHLMLPSRPSSN